MIHINHPDELTPETIKIIERFRRECFATVLSQSVFLKGVNDDFDTLYKLFTQLSYLRVRPYYLYRNDPVPWARHLTVEFEKKVEVPLDFWQWDKHADFKDFKGNIHPPSSSMENLIFSVL